MTEVPLLAGFDPGTVQWHAESLQMVNWGGFHGGPHQICFDADTTLVSGASGTGKSTLLDAYTALMMSSNTPFNGASNDAVRGRARGEGQRTLVSYIRGQRDAGDESSNDGTAVLRGDGAPTFSLLAITFVNDMGQRFSVLKTYYLPAGGQRLADVQQKMFTRSAGIDLTEVQRCADVRFDARALRAQISGLAHHDTQTKLADVVASRLGIGGAGESERPLRLLARIQAGHQVATVDRLYKQMVLERPSTFAQADAAWQQFADLERSYQDLETHQQKKDVLEGIDGYHQRMVDAEEKADRLDRFGVASPSSHTPFVWWRTHALEKVLDDAEDLASQAQAQAWQELDAAQREVDRTEQAYDDLRQALRDEGGERFEALRRRRTELMSRLEQNRRRRTGFDERTRVLGLRFESADEFAQLQETVDGGLRRCEQDAEAAREKRDALRLQRSRLNEQMTALVEEARSLEQRRGQVPRDLHQVRCEIAEACGMKAQDLPFLAEIVDLSPEYEDWRLAAEMALRGPALTMLIDAGRQAEVRRRIDGLSLRRRIRFEGAHPGMPVPDDLDPDWLSGRLQVRRDSPFAGWVIQRLTGRGTDHLCVDDPRDLGGDEPKVTRHGQTSHGRRGAHGRDPQQRFVLGFDNTRRRAEIADELADLVASEQEIKDQEAAQEAVVKEASRRSVAYEVLAQAVFEDLDVAGPEAELASVQTELDAMSQHSEAIAALERRVREAKQAKEEASAHHGRSAALLEAAQNRYATIVTRKDEAVDKVIEIERAGVEPLSDEDAAYLDGLLAAQPRVLDDTTFDACLDELKRDLTKESTLLRSEASRERAQLEAAFRLYNQTWQDDPNRGETAVEYPVYQAIYDDIVRHGLYDQRAEFKRRFQQWSGYDLTLLHSAYTDAHRDIDDRLEPVNDILRGLSFGPEDDRLQIHVRQTTPAHVTEFGCQLRELASNTTLDWTEDQLEERFTRLRQLMHRIAPEEAGGDGSRDELLDVRRHIEVTAVRQSVDGVEKARYSSLGGKSGGESQELAAFIVGAALRYQLGDDTRTRPQFAPVFLDEGFVKADGHFAGRAVQAWRGLGFQLIVSCPEDKVTALEPHMRRLHSVVKDQARGYSFIVEFTDLH